MAVDAGKMICYRNEDYRRNKLPVKGKSLSFREYVFPLLQTAKKMNKYESIKKEVKWNS